MDGRNFEKDNPFDKDNLDFYDKIICSDAKKDFSRLFLGLFMFNAIYVTIGTAVTIWLILVYGAEGAKGITTNIYYAMIMGVAPMYCIALPFLVLFVKGVSVRKPKKQPFGIKSFIKLIPVAILLMTLGNYIGIFINSIISAFKGGEIENSTANLLSASPTWLTIIMAVILGPIVEEFIFRKLMIDKLAKYGYVTAILVSSLAFGLFHSNFYQFFYAMLVGALLGYIYVKSGNWLLSVLMHAIINFYGGVIGDKITRITEELIPLSEQYIAGTLTDTATFQRYMTITQLYVYFHLAMLFIGGFVLFKAARRKAPILIDREKMSIPKGKRASTIFVNTGAILYLLSTAIMFIIEL